jgi:hypothetical protein
MRWQPEPVALADLAADVGLTPADVAAVAGLDESTISRLWNDARWLDRAKGATLKQLIGSVPGIADYVTAYSIASRLSELAEELASAGLEVDGRAVEDCQSDAVLAPYVGNALRAALHIVRGEDVAAAAQLARFWGRDQDRALERLFSGGEGRLLAEPEALISAAADLAPRLHRPAYSLHAVLASAVLAHHLQRSGPSRASVAVPADRHEAVSIRSNIMGALIEHDDLDLAVSYERLVAAAPVLRGIEEWAFPTYTRDARLDPGLTLPRSLLLRNTAAEVIREIGCYSAAYVHYLLTVYVPLALARDPTFGLALGSLRAAIRERAEHEDNPALRTACERTLRVLGGSHDD